MSNEVAVMYMPSSVMLQDVRGMDYDALEQIATLEDGGGSQSAFPGDRLAPKKGRYRWGWGDEAVIWREEDDTLIANIPNAILGWRWWKQDAKSQLGPISYPAMGQPLPARDTLGDEDQDLWDKDNKGKPKDPWQRYLMIPFRLSSDKYSNVHHLMLSSKTSVQAGVQFLREFARQGRAHPGMLPIVRMGMEEERFEIKHADGAREVITYDRPTITIVGWEIPKPEDSPNGQVAQVAMDAKGTPPPPRNPTGQHRRPLNRQEAQVSAQVYRKPTPLTQDIKAKAQDLEEVDDEIPF